MWEHPKRHPHSQAPPDRGMPCRHGWAPGPDTACSTPREGQWPVREGTRGGVKRRTRTSLRGRGLRALPTGAAKALHQLPPRSLSGSHPTEPSVLSPHLSPQPACLSPSCGPHTTRHGPHASPSWPTRLPVASTPPHTSWPTAHTLSSDVSGLMICVPPSPPGPQLQTGLSHVPLDSPPEYPADILNPTDRHGLSCTSPPVPRGPGGSRHARPSRPRNRKPWCGPSPSQPSVRPTGTSHQQVHGAPFRIHPTPHCSRVPPRGDCQAPATSAGTTLCPPHTAAVEAYERGVWLCPQPGALRESLAHHAHHRCAPHSLPQCPLPHSYCCCHPRLCQSFQRPETATWMVGIRGVEGANPRPPGKSRRTAAPLGRSCCLSPLPDPTSAQAEPHVRRLPAASQAQSQNTAAPETQSAQACAVLYVPLSPSGAGGIRCAGSQQKRPPHPPATPKCHATLLRPLPTRGCDQHSQAAVKARGGGSAPGEAGRQAAGARMTHLQADGCEA